MCELFTARLPWALLGTCGGGGGWRDNDDVTVSLCVVWAGLGAVPVWADEYCSQVRLMSAAVPMELRKMQDQKTTGQTAGLANDGTGRKSVMRWRCFSPGPVFPVLLFGPSFSVPPFSSLPLRPIRCGVGFRQPWRRAAIRDWYSPMSAAVWP